MPSFFRSVRTAGNYMLLDDESSLNQDESELLANNDLHTDQDISENYISDDDTSSENSFTYNLLKRLKLPRINFAYFTPSRRKRYLDVLLCLASLCLVLNVSLRLGYNTFVYHTPVIDKSYRAFGIPNHEAWLNYGALQAAKQNRSSVFQFGSGTSLDWLFRHRDGSSTSEGGKTWQEQAESWRHKRSIKMVDPEIQAPMLQYNPEWHMQVVFMVKEGENIFTKARLQQIHDIERKIMSHKKFPEFCFKDPFEATIRDDPAVKAVNGCAPLNSLMTYFFPSRDHEGNVYYDGLGDNMDNIDSALRLAMTSTKFYYYVDDKVNSSFLKSRLIRTEVIFGTPLKGFNRRQSHADREKQSERFKDFVISYIDILSKSSTDDVAVLYGGNEIFDYEVESTFWNDVRLAIYALVSIFLLMLILTGGSLWLTFWGYVSIILSAPLAIFFYRVVFKVVGLGILNGAAAFVIIGIGVDDVFVFINVFRQADHMTDTRARTLYTVKTAGKATFFTSFTTAAAFAANIASMIPAVHDFGLFMSLIVANCWITVMLTMPPVLYIWQLVIRKYEEKIFSFLCCCFSGRKFCSNLSLPVDVAKLMDPNHHSNHAGTRGQLTISRKLSEDDDDDVPLLTLENPTQYIDIVDTDNEDRDEGLIRVDPDPLFIPEDDGNKACHMGAKVQALIYRYLALPIIKIRWVILCISLVLLCISLGLVAHLKTSTKPPQFFKEDTNIQQILDLKSKYSTMGPVRCNDCSAIYSLGKEQRKTLPPSPATQQPPATYKPELTSSTLSSIFTLPSNTNQAGHPVTSINHLTSLVTTSKPSDWSTTNLKPVHQQTTAKPVKTTRKPKTVKPLTPAPPKHHQIISPAPAQPSNPATKKPAPISVPKDYDVCEHADCSHPKERPLLESGATVYVVVGVNSFHWSSMDIEHVMSDDTGVIEYSSEFSSIFNFSNPEILDGLKELCTICKLIANNTDLVRNGSAECLPSSAIPFRLKVALLSGVPECRDLPSPATIYGNIHQPAHALGGLTSDGKAILWLAFAFESTTSKGKSYFEAHKEYKKWDEFLAKIKKGLATDSSFKTMFQTSEFWPEVFMEIVAVDSAIYSIVLSMVICMVAVMLFTRHFVLLLIIFICITEMVCLVVGIFYILGWEIGGVEAISLSILVGSSVDYCVHLVEGYILASAACPIKDDAGAARRWRTSATFSHIGVSIISSALTTIIAAIPLTKTTIQPFAKFGQIIAINTTVCIVYSLTLCIALLATIAPAFFKPSWKSTLYSFLGTVAVIGAALLTMFIMTRSGVEIPGPNGGTLF